MHTVYLVDDDKPVIDAYWRKRGLFTECGFEICGAETVSLKALEEIRNLHPDVVISDLRMPGLSGIEMLDILNAEPLPPFFVIVSAFNEYKDVRKLFSTNRGFDYLVKPVSDNDLMELMCRLAAKIDCNIPDPDKKTGSQKLNVIVRYLEEYFTMNHTLESVAEHFSVAPNSICHLFSKYMGTTFSAHLIKLRMERAEHLLKTTDLRVKEISIKCGYANQFYFTRLFTKEHGGMSPVDYRKAEDEK